MAWGMLMAGDPRAAQVVRFWRAVEMFSPQGAPKPTMNRRATATEIVVDLDVDDIAPWDPRHWITKTVLPKDKVWQFSVYGGIYGVSRVREVLTSVFGRGENEFVERDDSQTAMFAFTLDAEGYLVKDSAALSACAWAVGRLQDPGPDAPGWLEGFKSEEKSFIESLNRLAPPRPEGRDSAGNGLASKAGKAVLGKVESAATEAVSAAAKATGDAVKVAAAAALTTAAGPIVGGIAGATAGAFVEKLLTPARSEDEPTAEAGGPASDRETAAVHRSAEPPRMTSELVHEFVSRLGHGLNVAASLGIDGVRVKCVQVHKRTAGEASEQNFLNSFIADDLLRVEDAVRDGDVGGGIRDYLADTASIDMRSRVDVRAFPGEVVAGVAPNRLPGGRWPTGIDRPLVMSQQFAVNRIMGEFASSAGVFGVNGPPGTGKTTMLRDVLAAIVVERAERIVDLRLSHPIEAFTDRTDRVAVGPKYTATVRWLRPEVTGSEIVVATQGNKAAANITEEIPGIGAVRGAEDEAREVDYFTDLASNVLGSEAWGLIAAKLGKRSNGIAFDKHFWWGDPAVANAPGQEQQEPVKSMKEVLADAAAEPMTAETWAEAVRRFNDARDEVTRLAAERQRVADAISLVTRRRGELPGLQARTDAARAEVARCRHELATVQTAAADADKALAESKAECDEHAARQPTFWTLLSTFFRAGRDWHRKARTLDAVLEEAKAVAGRLRSEIARHKAALGDAGLTQRRCEVALADVTSEITALEGQLAQARTRWPQNLPYPPDFTTEDEFQLCTPWADAELTEARNRLFLEALRLHKAFILGAGRRLRGNLEVIGAVLRHGLEVPTETLHAAWQTLFLVVPVVSTTFASLPRLFRGLGREAFGWLFVDEAGQATPQQALGGIWRARRSVIVGDPQQLEPIVSLPLSAQHALRRNSQVDAQWTPENTSAQRIADRLARFGTSLPEPDGDGRVWVGAPLRVHRRCERLMFDVSNDIAYGGDLMIYGTQVDGDYPGDSAWLDVQGAAQDNWVPDEGVALAHLLDELKRDGVAAEDLRVISPFRDAVRGAKDVGKERFGWSFAGENVGTVHTVQGQESNVVVLILGSAPRNDRARAWAAETPNLLNVAVSRAKRRLYVIGNRTLWQQQRYFDTLATRLPVRAWPPDGVSSSSRTL